MARLRAVPVSSQDAPQGGRWQGTWVAGRRKARPSSVATSRTLAAHWWEKLFDLEAEPEQTELAALQERARRERAELETYRKGK